MNHYWLKCYIGLSTLKKLHQHNRRWFELRARRNLAEVSDTMRVRGEKGRFVVSVRFNYGRAGIQSGLYARRYRANRRAGSVL